jgi:A/G-specific adenine glycosylase
VLRDAHEPVHRSRLDAAWDNEAQRAVCLAGLLEDGLVVRLSEDTYSLP